MTPATKRWLKDFLYMIPWLVPITTVCIGAWGDWETNWVYNVAALISMGAYIVPQITLFLERETFYSDAMIIEFELDDRDEQ